MSPKEAIGRLKNLKATLIEPKSFYLFHRAGWEPVAASVAVDTLSALQPPDADPERWQAACESAGRRVTASLLDGEELGVIVALGETPPGIQPGDPAYFRFEGISIRDVESWVEVSRSGELPEEVRKNLKAMDDFKTSKQVAWRLMYAIKLNKNGVGPRLAEHIRGFMGWELRADLENLYPMVLATWLDYFVPVVFDQWRQWVRQQIASAGFGA